MLGKNHDNILKLVTVQVTIVTTDVLEKRGALRMKDGPLPRYCSLGLEGCAMDDMTLWVDLEKVNMCNYGRVRVEMFQLMSSKEGNYFVNDEHKLLFEVRDKMALPAECTRGSQIGRAHV